MVTPDAEKSEPSESSTGSKSVFMPVIVAITLLLIALTAGYFVWSSKQGNGTAIVGGDTSALDQQLSTLRSALASTENLETEPANALWDSLQMEMPSDPSIALNRALNRVLRVDALAETATSPLSSDEEKQAARDGFTAAADAALQSIDDFDNVSDDKITGVWLRSRIDLHKADLLAVVGKSIRRDVFKRLSNALTQHSDDPRALILGGPLTRVISELEDPIDGLPTNLLNQAADAVGELSNKHSDNLLLAIRAAQLSIKKNVPVAKGFVQRTYELSAAIEPSLAVTTKPIGLTPRELVDAIARAIDANDYDQADNRMLQWFNVMNPTEILKADRRRVSPHPLDRLSFDTLRALSARAVDSNPVSQGKSALKFATAPIESSADIVSVKAIDFDLDLDDDLVSLSKNGQIQLWRNDDGNWQVDGSLQLGGKPHGLFVADLFMVDSSNPERIKSDRKTAEKAGGDFSASNRHNTFPGVLVYDENGAKMISVDGRATTSPGKRLAIAKETGLEAIAGITAIVTGDFEGDGDLDLAVATKENGLRVFVNRGNRSFFETTLHKGGFNLDDPISAMAIVDLDRDLDLDIVTVHPKSGRVGILENLLHLQFRGRVLDEVPEIKSASTIAIADVDGNVSWDLIVGGESRTAVVFSQTADAGAWTIDRIEEQASNGIGFVMADLDNDSWIDLITRDGPIRIGPWGLESPSSVNSNLSPMTSDSIAVTDFNGDGLLDIASIVENAISISTNETASESHHLFVRFMGQADNNARSGRVNHFGIGSVVELRFGPHYRSHVVTSPATHFGLDGFDKASSIRVIMPNGLTQTIRDPSVDTIVEEKQTLKGSCPYLYTWDGEKYVFATDCLWAAPLGLQVARGVVANDRPWEYLMVDGANVSPRDGAYELRITEELWEVAYFDKVALTAVDHPDDVNVWTNEKVGPGSIAKQTLFAFGQEHIHDLSAAVDTNGRDVKGLLSEIDRDFVQGFERRLLQGLCPPHWVDLDFSGAKIEQEDSVYLVLTGWILPTDTSLNIQIDQNPDLPAIEFPSVWAPDNQSDGGWRKVIPFMGFPGGKTKTIVVDVTDKILRDDPRLRVRTSAEIYWDCAQLAVQSHPPLIREHELNLLTAEVTFHGFSKRIKESTRHPETYDYQNGTTSPIWPPLRGGLTKFGNCLDLVKEWDDSMAVISSGDEIRLTFSVPSTPVPKGWTRDFVLHSVGWDKDADLNTLTGQTTGPLPYREMTSYPPNADAMDRTNHVARQNAKHLGRHQSFRAFWYRSEVFDTDPNSPTPFMPPSFRARD